VDVIPDIDTIYRACKRLGTDEQALIQVFGYRDGPTIDAIRHQYPGRTHHDLIQTLEKETSGHFKTALVATALGPLGSEVFFAHRAMTGLGTKEKMLTEAIMGKTNQQINAMKSLYHNKYRESLENAVRSDLSMKTEKLFLMVLSASKMDEHVPINPAAVSNDVRLLYGATQGRLGTDELAVCSMFTRSSDAHLRAVAHEYKRQYNQDVPKMIKKEFSGHMEGALLFIIEGAIDKPARDATLLEDSMKGLGTQDELLISRLIRAHWDKAHFLRVKQAYHSIYGRDLTSRVRGDTSGDYGRLMVALTS
jgi:annexin A7/11